MPPELVPAVVAAVVNVPVLVLAIFGVWHFSRELAAVRQEIRELGLRLIDELGGALERSDPRIAPRADPPPFDEEDTHDGETKIVERPKPIVTRRK